jgi:hypothetical protein
MFQPTKEPEKQTEQKVPIATNIPPQLMEHIEQLAEDNNLNKSQLLRQMIYYCMNWEE